MTLFQDCWMALPVVSLLALGCVPSRLMNSHPTLFGRLVVVLAGFAFIGSLATGVDVMLDGPLDATLTQWTTPIPLRLGFHIDGLAALTAGLISFLGLVIARYSITYLQGDSRQGQFFRWMALTLGATLLMVCSCNLVLFTTAWMLTSFGLHQLLSHYQERTWAIWAARKKFLISRLGDLMLITAMILCYCCFGTTEYAELFAMADAIHTGATTGGGYTAMIGVLLVLGAMTKSAQFPFHTWLPDTMETPTPVSALMHAGVINAGGFLMIRLSPLVSLSPLSLDLLALVGAFTAIFGCVVMLTQTSIKRSLAYSTIAQMGFMMLQCGLGAFSAALLHIVSHAAYKAHAFLSCGSVLDKAAQMTLPPSKTTKPAVPMWAILASVFLAAGIVFGLIPAIGFKLVTKPGGLVLGLILTMALAQLLWQGISSGSGYLSFRSLVATLLIVSAYLVGYQTMDRIVASSTSHHTLVPSMLNVGVVAVVITGFINVFILQILSRNLAGHPWARALYVHAMNGFYVDIPARRITAFCYRQSAPVQ